jgi:hypothetical protein
MLHPKKIRHTDFFVALILRLLHLNGSDMWSADSSPYHTMPQLQPGAKKNRTNSERNFIPAGWEVYL